MAAEETLSFYRKWRRRIGRHPVVRRVYEEVDIALKYKQLRPERVPLANSSNVIFVDPTELRGRAILRTYGAGQVLLKRFWREAIQRLSPDVVIDVGANYGEFLFMTSYAPGAIVVGIEANPTLLPYLRRSRDAHPQGASIDVVCGLAAAADGPSKEFFIDTVWSGRSSALRLPRNKSPRVELVKTVSVDSLVADRMPPNARLVFKIDVEGYEPPVVEGMVRTLAKTEAAVGLLELNTTFLRALDVEPEAFLDRLRERFVIHGFRDHVHPVDVTHRTLASVFGEGEVSTDLLVATDAALLPAIDRG